MERINHYTPVREVIMRVLQSLFTAVAQPIISVLLVPQFFEKILQFFNAIDAQRNWQSAGKDDILREARIYGTNTKKF